jgi:hypothetical protein
MAGEQMPESLMGAIGRTIEEFYPNISPFDVYPIAKKVAEMIKMAVEEELMEQENLSEQ